MQALPGPAQQAVNIVFLGEEDNLAGQPAHQQHSAGPESGLAACSVTIVKQLDTGAESGKPFNLFGSEFRKVDYLCDKLHAVDEDMQVVFQSAV